MNLAVGDLIVIGVCAVVGYCLVWFAISLHSRYRDNAPDHRAQEQESDRTDEHMDDGSQRAREWYQVLEVAETATIEVIRAAYRKKIMQYHPDRVETLGLEFKHLAESRTQEINRAYEFACKLRN